ncbi:MAG: heme-binding protein [Gammaproteobacteria bacterium]|nr:heme-binding protein [Gammaproteobacteria bacterium]
MKNILKKLSLITLMLGLSTGSYAADESMTVSIKRMKMETALRIAQAAIKACRKEGVQIAVTVVDRSGQTQVVLRDVLAMDITLPISKQKAHTAMAFNSALSAIENRFTKPHQVPKIDGLVMSAGGIPINIGGSILGGIGVSGAPSGEVDEKCATAGLDAVRDDLEME